MTRSKEDHVHRISKSVFVTNFPDNFGSRDLWVLCEAYGKVVDVFIPNRKSKAGKRFAFIRFIRVVDMDRLIGNMCTLWVGRFHLHANVVRYESRIKSSTSKRVTAEKPPSSFNHRPSATHDLVINERIVWVDIEGLPLNLWSSASFSKIGQKWGNVMDIEESLGSSFARKRLTLHLDALLLGVQESGYNSEDDSFLGNVNNLDTPQHDKANSTGESDDEGLSDTIFGDNSQSPCHDRHDENVQETTQHSEDPFGLYKLLKKPINNLVAEDATSLSHPPGFTPQVQSYFTHNGGSILEVLDDMIKVGRSMGYEMEGCSNDIERIISLQGVVGGS
nr:hypothetical protein CTI12_AA308650 [Tanacetum cinerariifolium]